MKACLVAGDEAALARRLGVPVPTVVDWLLGDMAMPADMFLQAVDIVMADSKEQIEVTRSLLEQIRRRHRRGA